MKIINKLCSLIYNLSKCQSMGFGMGFVYNLATTLKSLTTLRTLMTKKQQL